ncbi:MAG TPA: hypothetical protein VK078_07840 [Pseudogracilibacillus sp.]|nr:hypothetical protein [Pseudogracilibacillus sp.]
MTYLIVSLIGIAIVLFIVSFFADDKVTKLEEQFEQFSITTMQDTYQLKKRIKILEEEILSSNISQKPNNEQNMRNVPDSVKHKPLLIQKVYHLQQQGYSISDISQQTTLSEDDIQTILNNQN